MTRRRQRTMKINCNRKETQTVPKVALWTVPKRLKLPAAARTAPKVALWTVQERLIGYRRTANWVDATRSPRDET
jgi:hypothetical protein